MLFTHDILALLPVTVILDLKERERERELLSILDVSILRAYNNEDLNFPLQVRFRFFDDGHRPLVIFVVFYPLDD